VAEGRKITPSEVLLVARGGPPKNLDPESSKRGIEAHKVIRGRIENGQPPGCLAGICQRSPQFEQRRRREIGPDGLAISTKVDVVTDYSIVEFKPRLTDLGHRLQAAIEAHAASRPNAVIYAYNRGGWGEGETVVLRGVDQLGDQIEEICRGAREILDLQQKIDEEKRRPKKGPRTVRQVADRNKGDPIGFACEIREMGRIGGAQRKSLGYEIVEERKR